MQLRHASPLRRVAKVESVAACRDIAKNMQSLVVFTQWERLLILGFILVDTPIDGAVPRSTSLVRDDGITRVIEVENNLRVKTGIKQKT